MAVADDDARAQDRERQVRPRAHELLGLELRLLVGVVEALADVEVALEERAGVGAGDVRGRDLGVALEHAELLRPAGELEHPARPLDVDRARLLERQAERHRCGAVDDRRRLRRQPIPVHAIQPEARRGQLAGDRGDPIRVAAGPVPEQIREHRVEPLARGLVAVGADDRDHRPLGPLQVAREQLHPDEPGGAGEQDGPVRARHSLALRRQRPERPGQARARLTWGDQLVDVAGGGGDPRAQVRLGVALGEADRGRRRDPRPPRARAG